ncbi:MAG TPA: phospholipase D-like domain-containing protein [Gammaproteobacteria bacterium]|jgi:cardiolipin synthase|nr:phospholipase D-like domain-containing protein [Gammaproteobacteria bacterium]
MESLSNLPARPPERAAFDFELYTEGDTLYDAMLEAIGAARESIRLEVYIFADDEVGRRFADALAAQAGRGCKVYVHIDTAGSLFRCSRRMTRFLKRHGVVVRWYHRVSWRPGYNNRRNHRKLLVIDRETAFVGGFNLHRQCSMRVFGAKRWRDTHIAVRGPLVREAVEIFDALWRHRRRQSRREVTMRDTALVTNRPRRWKHPLRRLYSEAFASAERSIYLTTPYLVPDLRTQRAMAAAVKRGVDVRLLVPKRGDSRLAEWAAHAAFAKLLRKGVRIYEYLPRVLHAKTAVVDRRWSTVGTANFDYRSFFLNYELNVVTPDPRLAATLEHDFLCDLKEAVEVRADRWARRGLPDRITEFIGWLGRRWL